MGPLDLSICAGTTCIGRSIRFILEARQAENPDYRMTGTRLTDSPRSSSRFDAWDSAGVERADGGLRIGNGGKIGGRIAGVRSNVRTEFGKDLVGGATERALEGAPGSVFMSAAAKLRGNGRYVDLALAAQADADAAIGKLAQKNGGLDTRDGEGEVGDAFAILF